jgi:hypothetical protein
VNNDMRLAIYNRSSIMKICGAIDNILNDLNAREIT